MRFDIRGLALLLTVLTVAACNQNSPPAQTKPAATPAPVAAPALPPAAPQPAPIPPGTELPVASVNSVMLNRPPDAPGALIINASGMTLSAGWTNPRLAEDPQSRADPSVKTFKFVATSPQTGEQNPAQANVEAEIRVDSLSPDVKSIRVISSSNEISAPVTE